ncbi:MAG: ATP-binding protein [Bacteroidales bacterium]|nr:ATP-binding protein [Bacteroidales bacterium]
MKITKLSFKNKNTGWYIDDIQFSKLTLLVGASGVGKTQILRTIMGLQKISEGSSMNGWSWTIEFEDQDKKYKWDGEYSCMTDNEESDDFLSNSKPVSFIFEHIYVNEQLIVDRKDTIILFKGEETPKLDSTKSIISLLKEEDLIQPIFQAWNHLDIMTLDDNSTRTISFGREYEIIRSTAKDINTIRKAQISLIDKLYLLKKNNISLFNQIEDSFKEIFPLVEKVDFEIIHVSDITFPLLKIKERNVTKWIKQGYISSGMFRTLLQIIMISMAEDGDVILIDEFENSLGINCIDSVADLVRFPDNDIQFIITSHHPYIINNIDFKNWKIVTRNGSKVSVISPYELHIGTHSKHDAFIQLVQTDAYKKGFLL